MTEKEAINDLLRVRAAGQGHTRIYSYLCNNCGEVAWSYRVNASCCSSGCAKAVKPGIGHGDKNPCYKGGRYKTEQGYVMLSGMWSHPHRHPTRGTVAEHRIVMESHIGRRLRSFENVHHKNGIRSDNRIENLELWAVPQPYGQRVDDLVSWVLDSYESEIRNKLVVKDAVRAVLERVTKKNEPA